MKKTIQRENGTITIEGTEEWLEIEFREDEENEENEENYIAGFEFNGQWYNLQDFPRIHNNLWTGQAPDWLSEYHAIMNTSAFNGILLKLDDSGDAVQVFTF